MVRSKSLTTIKKKNKPYLKLMNQELLSNISENRSCSPKQQLKELTVLPWGVSLRTEDG
jgi:hypothetical protein